MSSLVLGVLHLLGATGAASQDGDWLSRNSTLVVGVVGIVFSGFVGPTVVAYFAGRREVAKDARALAVARQGDLRLVLDEAAQVLSGAVGQLRPLLAAALAGNDLPQEPADFLGSLAPLGHRLRLRLPDEDPVVASFEGVVERLRGVAQATSSQAEFDTAVTEFETARDLFLANSRAKLREDIFKDKAKTRQ